MQMWERMNAKEYAALIRNWEARHWTPATSSNFSFRVAKPSPAFCAISRSGVDKSGFEEEDFLYINESLEWRDPPEAKPSAETLIHLAIYRWKPEIQFVAHTHSVADTVLSMNFAPEQQLRFSGYEIQKAFEGESTHESEVFCPIFPNSQDMAEFSQQLEQALQDKKRLHGFLIAGHGLYTWGENLAQLKRHMEAWQFLFQCRLEELRCR